MGRFWVGRGYLWSFMKFQCRSSFVSCFINDCSASLKSAADDAGFGDTGNTEKEPGYYTKKYKKRKKRRKKNDQQKKPG